MQDKYHLYFLFDLMSGGDLMDVLVAEAQAGSSGQLRAGLRATGGRRGGALLLPACMLPRGLGLLQACICYV